MKNTNRMIVGGTYNFKIIDSKGEIVNSFSKKNMIVNNALNAYAGLISGMTTLVPKYLSLGIGIGDSPVSSTQVWLDDEFYRSKFASAPVFNPSEVPGKVSFSWTVDYDTIASNPKINEIGVFARSTGNSDATIESTPNTGMMMSRMNVDLTLNPGETLLITRIDSFSTV